MSFYQDRQIRAYGLFMACFSLCIVGMGLLLSMVQMKLAKASYLSHSAAIATVLFQRDIPSTVIAAALTNTEVSEEGAALLARIGVNAKTESGLFPFHAQLQCSSFAAAAGMAILLVIVLIAGTWAFFSARKRLYCQADQAVSGYLCGDYSQHLPRSSEGAIYQIFAQVEQLATMLQAKTETEHQAKEFLKKSISDISHQLKTPLAALTMYQEIIADEPEHPDTVREFSAKMSVSLKRMEYLIQAMLKITRLDTGNITFEKQNLPMSDLIFQSIRELTTRAERENKQILVGGDARQKLACDRDWTCEAIGNIVKNALDHTDSGGTVRIHWEHTPAMLRIFITDNGSGIAPEDIHHIFKRFYRSKRSLDTQGIGLGLPLAKSIIEGQGGIIAVQSDPEAGTTFTLSFLTELQAEIHLIVSCLCYTLAQGGICTMKILTVQNLCKTYGKGEAKVDALKNVSFSLEKGEFAAVVGESGSGKSTLLNCIGALDTPSSGEVRMDGQNLFSMGEEKRTIFRRRNIGFIFQSFQLVSELNVEQNIIFPLLLDYKKPKPAAVQEILELLGLTSRRNHLPNQLSGGQQQRVAIGRALITKPKLILADEPTGNLDSKNSRDVMELLTQASRHYQQTILMITHNRNLTASVDRVFQVADGVLTDLGGEADETLS